MAVLIIFSWVALPCSAQGISDMQLFAPYTPTSYGTQPHPNEGLFFTFEYMMWNVSTPEKTTIGAPGVDRTVWNGPDISDTWRQGSTYDTGLLSANFTNGQRYELGRIWGRHGWMFSAYHLNSQTNNINTRSMNVAFIDREWGDDGLDHGDGPLDDAGLVIEALPVTFHTAKIHNRVRTWSVELDYLIRTRRMHKGGFFEMALGCRYLEFNEDFYVEALGRRVPVEDDTTDTGTGTGGTTTDDEETATTVEGTLADSLWTTDAENHIVGPQIGLRYFHRYKHFTISTEGKCFAGFNSQNIYQNGQLGSELDPPGGVNEPIAMGPSSFEHQRTFCEWSPGFEFRLQGEWQVTRHVSLGVGYSGIWLGGIARPSNMIAYQLGSEESESDFMGIIAENNRQDVFINGVSFKISFNR